MRDSNRRNFLKVAGAGTTMGLLAGCAASQGGNDDSSSSSSSGDGSSGGSSDPIVIGELAMLTGPFAADGARQHRGLQFAIDRINQSGTLDRELKLKSVDTGSNAQKAVNAFTRMIEQDDIIAAVGPGSSKVGIQTSRVAEDRGVPLLLFAAGGVSLSKSNKYTFRIGLPPISMDAKAQAQWIGEDKSLQKVGGIVESAVWGQGFKKALSENLPDNVEFVSKDAPITQTDFTSYLRNMPKDVDVFTGSGHPVGLDTMYQQAYSLGFDPKAFPAAIEPASVSYDTIGDGVFKTFAPFYNVDFTSDKYKSVASDYYEANGEFFDNPDACGYVSAKCIEEAIATSGDVSRDGVSKGMRNMKLDTVFTAPLQYTDWCEFDGVVQTYYKFEEKTPSYNPDLDFTLTPAFRSDPLSPPEPSE